MVLTDIETHVKPLSKVEKEQLIRDVQRMLVDDDIEHHGEDMLREMFPSGATFPIYTPNVMTDDSDLEAAAQLQRLLEEHGHEI